MVEACEVGLIWCLAGEDTWCFVGDGIWCFEDEDTWGLVGVDGKGICFLSVVDIRCLVGEEVEEVGDCFFHDSGLTVVGFWLLFLSTGDGALAGAACLAAGALLWCLACVELWSGLLLDAWWDLLPCCSSWLTGVLIGGMYRC